MKAWLNLALALTFFAIVGGVSCVVFQLAKLSPTERPTLGARGLKRGAALSRSPLFALAEPMLRVLASWAALLPLERVRAPMRTSLGQAGDYLGLSDDELIAICALAGVSTGCAALAACKLMGMPLLLALAAMCLSVLVPWFRILGIARARARSVGRGLPAAVELASMCMSAGLDFPGSLRRIVDSASDSSDPVIEEFARVLQELDLGHTRRSAMQGFAARVPTDQVREFVSSVVQAESKGSPLASVLTIQAQTQRLRRSIAAEETASEAALMLLGPMTLIFLCVIVLLLGPVVVRFMTGGLGPT